MITKIPDLPDHVLGFEASGEVTKDDYEQTIMPAVDELAKRTGELYYLFVIKTGLDHFSMGAFWDDAKVGLQHFRQWKKIAIASDSKNIERLLNIFSFLIPGKVKGFHLDEIEQARKWVAEK